MNVDSKSNKLTANFSTGMLMWVGSKERLEKCYREKKLEFSCAANWVDYAQNGNFVTGDYLECIFAHVNNDDPRLSDLRDSHGLPMGNHIEILRRSDDQTSYLRYTPTLMVPLFDFFRNEVEVECLNRNGERVPISQYANLDAETLLHTDNLYLDAILPSFQKLTRHDETIARANFVLLELLGAYDRSGNPEFLNTAEEFSAWIMTASEQELQYDIRLLNDLQIKKRRRDLTAEEETELVQITEDRDVLEQIKVGAYLLLNQQTAARIHFERLKPNEQEEFRKYPICRFCENF